MSQGIDMWAISLGISSIYFFKVESMYVGRGEKEGEREYTKDKPKNLNQQISEIAINENKLFPKRTQELVSEDLHSKPSSAIYCVLKSISMTSFHHPKVVP